MRGQLWLGMGIEASRGGGRGGYVGVWERGCEAMMEGGRKGGLAPLVMAIFAITLGRF